MEREGLAIVPVFALSEPVGWQALSSHVKWGELKGFKKEESHDK